MNEIEVKTITKTPAVIEFNHEELLNDLEENLKKYDGLTFAETETKELRKVLAKLRKGAKAVDRYRIDTKKELNEPVNEFEKKCKEIVSKFDERIINLNEQLRDYEKQWKEKRIVKVQEIIANVINESELNEKYASRLVVDEDHLKKGISDNRLKEMIEFQANGLMQEQEKEAADREVIETYVKLKSNEFDVELPSTPYLSHLDFKDVAAIKNDIDNDASGIAAERKRKEEMKQKEAERLEREAQMKVEKELEKPKEVVTDNHPIESEETTFEPIIEDLPFGDIKKSVAFVVTATPEQVKDLEEFMDEKNINWSTREELPF